MKRKYINLLAERVQSRGKTSNEPAIMFVFPDIDQLLVWMELLVKDVWNYEQGLDATQQLLALACVKTTMSKIKQGMEHHNPDRLDEYKWDASPVLSPADGKTQGTNVHRRVA